LSPDFARNYQHLAKKLTNISSGEIMMNITKIGKL